MNFNHEEVKSKCSSLCMAEMNFKRTYEYLLTLPLNILNKKLTILHFT